MMMTGLEVRIWGTRGSLAAPYTDRMRFGGNTSCVSVRWDKGLAVFDCGSGLRGLAQELETLSVDSDLASGSGNGKTVGRTDRELHLFLSHVHLDHICALPFFPLLFQQDWTIHLYGSGTGGNTFRETLGEVIQPPFWPITLDQVKASLIWHDLSPDCTLELSGGVRIRTFAANHEAGTLLYRLEQNGVSVVYGLDHELTEETRAAYYAFVKHTDLLIFDGMYTEEEYQHCKGFGHSVWRQGAELTAECGIGTLCISHHDWSRTDEQLECMEQEAKKLQERCVFAREGMSWLLTAEERNKNKSDDH